VTLGWCGCDAAVAAASCSPSHVRCGMPSFQMLKHRRMKLDGLLDKQASSVLSGEILSYYCMNAPATTNRAADGRRTLADRWKLHVWSGNNPWAVGPEACAAAKYNVSPVDWLLATRRCRPLVHPMRCSNREEFGRNSDGLVMVNVLLVPRCGFLRFGFLDLDLISNRDYPANASRFLSPHR
jgi:hypothetical protein